MQRLWPFGFFIATLSAQATNTSMVQFLASQQLVDSGKTLFRANCSGCHGLEAKGNGPASAMLNPKPRNLVSGAFKFRSTPLGTLPTDQDLLRTLEQGILGTSMPGFPLLSSSQKYALVAYIKSLRPDWEKNVGRPYDMSPVPQDIFSNRSLLLASAQRGRKLFEEGCLTCHGDQGRGDGPSAQGLVDNDENPIHPANLSAEKIKSGKRAQDVFKAILTGLDGTPMPSFDGVYKESQIWDLVAYLFFLRGQSAGIYDPNLTLSEALTQAESNLKKTPSAEPNKTTPSKDGSWQ